MNKFFKNILLLTAFITAVSCSKNDDNTEPLRDYTVQYTKDIATIEAFMHTHYMTVDADQNATFTLLATGDTHPSIWDQTDYPIQTRIVTIKQNDVDVNYKLYYIQLRQGSGPNSKSPCNVDKVLTSYRGEYIYSSTDAGVTTIKSKQFEELIGPQSFFSLTGVIRGWSEIFPQFKTGSYVGNADGTISYSDFGAGIMFIPSGLAYYSSSTSSIPSYSPLVFTFKLYEIERTDQDADGIPSYLEDINGDGYVYVLSTGVSNPDNSDGVAVAIPGSNPIKYYETDEVPDFLDVDDDNDNYTTASEIKNPGTGLPYNFDDIPTCGGSGNGKKKYLDPTCHN